MRRWTAFATEIADDLKNIGYEVCGSTGRGEDAITSIRDLRPDLVLMDITLAGNMDGIRTAGLVSALNIPVIFLSAFSDEKSLERAKQSNPYGYLLKPFTQSELKQSLRSYCTSTRRTESCAKAS